MIKELKEKFEEEFGAEVRIPKPCIIKESKLYEVSEGLKNAEFSVDPVSEGLLLAYGTHASHRLLEYNKNRVEDYMILNEKSSFLFTCNRKVLKRGVVETHGNGPVYLALNEKREVLGVIQYEEHAYKNRVNIGVYFKEDDLNEVIF